MWMCCLKGRGYGCGWRRWEHWLYGQLLVLGDTAVMEVLVGGSLPKVAKGTALRTVNRWLHCLSACPEGVPAGEPPV